MEIRLEAVKYALPAAFVRRFMDLYALPGKFKAANAAKIQAVGNGTLIPWYTPQNGGGGEYGGET